MPSDVASDLVDDIDLPDSYLVSLLMRCPDLIDSSFEDIFPASPPLEPQQEEENAASTPLSNTGHSLPTSSYTTPATSFGDGESSHSTSLPEEPTFNEFLEHPSVSIELAERLTAFRDVLYSINVQLFPEDQQVASAETAKQIMQILQPLTRWFSLFHDAIKNRVNNILFILALAPFTIDPPREAYWTCYKQRAELVVRHTRPPNPADFNLLFSFIQLFEDLLVIKGLQHPHKIDMPTQDVLLDAYFALLSCGRAYNNWLTQMKKLGDIYMKPLMRNILADEGLQKSILQQQDDTTVALLRVDHVKSDSLVRHPSVSTNVCLDRSAEVAKQSRRFR